MRFRRDPDKPVNIITEDDLDEAMQAAGAKYELADSDEVPYRFDEFQENPSGLDKPEFADLDEVLAGATAESEAEYRIELKVPQPNPGFLFLAESLAVGVTTNGFVITEPTGRRLSAFLADGGQLVLTVYDDEGEYRHIRLGSDGQRSLRAWLDQAAS